MGSQIQLAAFGVLPALLAMFVFDWMDAKRPEPRWSLRKVTLAGCLSVLPVFFIERGLLELAPHSSGTAAVLYRAFIGAALPEECFKWLCIYLVIWRRPEFDERLDGIVYAAHAALGFALVENVKFLWTSPTPDAYLATFAFRAAFVVPGHAVWSGVVGYFAARRRFDGRGPGVLGGLALAIVLHGLYDAAIYSVPLLAEPGGDWAAALVSLAALNVMLTATFVRHVAKRALADDDAAEDCARSALGTP